MIHAVQQAIYARLSAVVDIAEVFDFMPQQASYPCVIIGDALEYENETDSEINAFDSVLTIHSWTKETESRGYKQLDLIMEQVRTALHHHDLQVSGYGVTGLFLEFNEKLRDSDGLTRHGVQRFRLIYEKIEG